jgi:hypothetical protein
MIRDLNLGKGAESVRPGRSTTAQHDDICTFNLNKEAVILSSGITEEGLGI